METGLLPTSPEWQCILDVLSTATLLRLISFGGDSGTSMDRLRIPPTLKQPSSYR
jgi:hypothetical protein